jgi:hypothetical protein
MRPQIMAKSISRALSCGVREIGQCVAIWPDTKPAREDP